MSEEKQFEEMRKDLIEIFDEEYEKRRLITADFTAIKMTDKGYRKQSEWISVDERLPERNGRYLTHCNVEGQSLVCILYYNKVGGFNEGTVTHWMPLSEPPKMKGGAE